MSLCMNIACCLHISNLTLLELDSITCNPLTSTLAAMDHIVVALSGTTVAGSDAMRGIRTFDFETLQFPS